MKTLDLLILWYGWANLVFWTYVFIVIIASRRRKRKARQHDQD